MSLPSEEQEISRTHRTHCIRCGECCLEGSPSLHTKDLKLIDKGDIERRILYTIRKGELVRDNVQGKMVIIDQEMIKLKEKLGDRGGCSLYNEREKACLKYEKRPIELALSFAGTIQSQCDHHHSPSTENYINTNEQTYHPDSTTRPPCPDEKTKEQGHKTSKQHPTPVG